ncbi:MAG: helix-turn-helix transcriptional regulator [PVC group bacterium]|nr:helix-turn-helix transcriptional regulator [PVC group bacterium]
MSEPVEIPEFESADDYFEDDSNKYRDVAQSFLFDLLKKVKVRTYRKSLGMDQSEFGRLINVSSQTISKWEHGHTKGYKIKNFGDYMFFRRSMEDGDT